MARRAEGERTALKLSELLKAGQLTQDTGEPRPRAGVTPCGRFGFRYDDAGRFFAVRLSDPEQEPLELS